MIVIIMRHGEAVEYREPDHSRALTDFGKLQCERAGKWLATNLPRLSKNALDEHHALSFALISPYLRTQQTYRSVVKAIKVNNQVTIDTITPMGNAAQCADLIHGYASDSSAPKSLLIVTHMPLVSLLADKICADFDADYFDTANALVIDYDVDSAIGKQLAFYEGH